MTNQPEMTFLFTCHNPAVLDNGTYQATYSGWKVTTTDGAVLAAPQGIRGTKKVTVKVHGLQAQVFTW